MEENQRRDFLLQELRDFVAYHGAGNALTITYQQLEDRFVDLRGVRGAHFNALSGLDAFGNVASLFVIGRPLPATIELHALALALTGRVVSDEQPVVATRGALLEAGTGASIQVRGYADPDMEALRSAITDAEVVQAIGRGRGVNRTADNPLTVFLLADVLLPIPVMRVVRWVDVRLSPVDADGGAGARPDIADRRCGVFPRSVPERGSRQEGLPEGPDGDIPL